MPSVDQLLFVGLNGWVAALDRDSGEVIWYNSELNSGYTTLLLDGDRLIVSTNGYLYCLDPQNGKVVWKNPMTGYGTGIAHLVSVPRPEWPGAAQSGGRGRSAEVRRPPRSARRVVNGSRRPISQGAGFSNRGLGNSSSGGFLSRCTGFRKSKAFSDGSPVAG